MFTHPHKARFARLRFMSDAENGGGAGGDGGNGESQGGDSKYTPPATQADLDRIIEGRLAREREKFKDFDALKEKASKWDEYEAGNRTPDEKALEEAKTAAVTETTQKFLQRLVRTEVKAVASTLGFNDPDDALRVIGDELPVKDDEPDTEAIKKAVEKLAAEKPYLVAAQKRRPAERPKPKPGEPAGDEKQGKGRAAAALRQLATARKGS